MDLKSQKDELYELENNFSNFVLIGNPVINHINITDLDNDLDSNVDNDVDNYEENILGMKGYLNNKFTDANAKAIIEFLK